MTVTLYTITEFKRFRKNKLKNQSEKHLYVFLNLFFLIILSRKKILDLVLSQNLCKYILSITIYNNYEQISRSFLGVGVFGFLEGCCGFGLLFFSTSYVRVRFSFKAFCLS